MIRIETPTRDQFVNEALADKIIALLLTVSPDSICLRHANCGVDTFGHPVIAICLGRRCLAEIHQLP
jgi:hypothetical protein